MSAAAALDLPDVPRWVYAHGIAAAPASWRRALGAGFAVGHDGARLAVVAGAAEPRALLELARAHPAHTLLVADAALAEALAAARDVARATLHTLADPAELPDLDGAVPLPPDASLAHVPPASRAELEDARDRGAAWTVYVDGAPASFAYAPWRSARWFDISVDTLPAARQLGLGTLTAAALIRAERAHGREPVWGAEEDNLASVRLARRLGFVAADTLWVAAP